MALSDPPAALPGPDRDEPAAARAPSLAALVAVSSVGPLGLNIITPSVPGLVDVFGVSYGAIQLTLTLYLLAFAVAPLALGALSDRFGRRPVLLAGLVLFMLGSALCLVANDYWTFLIGRVVQAMGGSAGLIIARAMIIDCYSGDRAGSMMAYAIAAISVTPALAVPLGGVLDEQISWRASFAVCLALGAAVAAYSHLRMPETNRLRSPLQSVVALISNYRQLLNNRCFLSHALLSAALITIYYAFLGGTPYVMASLWGHTPSDFGIAFMLLATTYVAANWVSGRATAQIGADRMIKTGAVLASLGPILMLAALATGSLNRETLFGLMMLSSIGTALAVPNANTRAIATLPRIAGAASGLTGALQLGLAGLAVAIVGPLQEGAGSALPTLTMMLLSGILAIAALIARRETKERTA